MPASYTEARRRDARQGPGPAVLICPVQPRPPERVLLVHAVDSANDDGLRTLAELCRGLGAQLLVLTVAATEAGARRAEEAARTALAEPGAEAIFDSVIGADTHLAVPHIARWRQCQVIAAVGRPAADTRRWFRPPTGADLLGPLSDSFAYLLLSGSNRAAGLPPPATRLPVGGPAPRAVPAGPPRIVLISGRAGGN